MHMTSDNSSAARNPYFPLSIRCDGDRQGESHGTIDQDRPGVSVQIGAENGCIYRVERQGPSSAITAVRYTWYTFDQYYQETFGEFVYPSASSDPVEHIIESYDGCIFGVVGTV